MSVAVPSPPHDRLLWPTLAEGQTVKIIGVGGTGGIAARYGSTFLAAAAASQGVNVRVVLVDGDSFEPSNAARMLFASTGNKAVVLREELLERFRDSPLSIESVEEYVTRESIARIVRSGDIVLLAVDNHATRKLVSEFCGGSAGWSGLENVCLISAGNDGVGPDSTGAVRRGTFGNCQVFLRREGRDFTPSLTRFHEEIRQPLDRPPGEVDCVEAILSVQQNLLANLMAASSMLNALWLHLCGGGALRYSELAFDIAEGLMRPVRGVEFQPSVGGPETGNTPLETLKAPRYTPEPMAKEHRKEKKNKKQPLKTKAEKRAEKLAKRQAGK